MSGPHWTDQGWNDLTRLNLAERFIHEKKLGDDYEDFLQKVANEENEESNA